MDLLDSILAAYSGQRVRTQRRGGHVEYLVLCPFHADRHVGSFSFSERGFNCFACGEKGGLRKLAAQLGIFVAAPLPVLTRPTRPEPTPFVRDWQQQPDYWRRFLDLPDHARAYYHGRGFTDETIATYRLGFGTLPSSKCLHPRYILPCFESGRLVALRGRQCQDDDPHDKWLCSGGSKTILFGAESLRSGTTVVITEAPYSAILAQQETPGIAAVAGTGGASCWRDEWTARIRESEPAWVLIVYDHDDAGEVNGQRVLKSLQTAGVRARRYRWNVHAGAKADLADVLAAGQHPLPKPRRLESWDHSYV